MPGESLLSVPDLGDINRISKGEVIVLVEIPILQELTVHVHSVEDGAHSGAKVALMAGRCNRATCERVLARLQLGVRLLQLGLRLLQLGFQLTDDCADGIGGISVMQQGACRPYGREQDGMVLGC